MSFRHSHDHDTERSGCGLSFLPEMPRKSPGTPSRWPCVPPLAAARSASPAQGALPRRCLAAFPFAFASSRSSRAPSATRPASPDPEDLSVKLSAQCARRAGYCQCQCQCQTVSFGEGDVSWTWTSPARARR
jgi:hypothetical protein